MLFPTPDNSHLSGASQKALTLGTTLAVKPALVIDLCDPPTTSSIAPALFDLDRCVVDGDTSRMAHVISLPTLRTLSAAAIARLPGPLTIESDGRPVAMLIPVRPAFAEGRARFRQTLAQAKAGRTPGEQQALDREFGP